MRINHLPKRLIFELEEAFKSEKSGKQRIIYQAILLLAKGWEREKVSEVVGLSPERIRQLITLYNKRGIKGLLLKFQPGNNHLLSLSQKEHIKDLISTKSPAELGLVGRFWSIKLLKILVEKEFNLTYKDQDSYRRLFIWCGFSFSEANRAWNA